MNYIDRVLAYAQYGGWKIFPSIWKASHTPLIKWKESASSDVQVIKAWAEKWPDAYFCVALQASGLVVIDVDNKNGREGSDLLSYLTLIHDELPKTLEVKTPSNGQHLIYKADLPDVKRNLRILSGETFLTGIDIPVMIPVPGTVIPQKGTYEIVNDLTIGKLPEWFVSLIKKDSFKKTEHRPALAELDKEHHIASAIEYLLGAAPAIEGDSGDHHTFVTACFVRDHGVSEDTCFQLMAGHWNERCEPPWGQDALRKKVENAYRYAKSQEGEYLPEVDFEAVEDTKAKDNAFGDEDLAEDIADEPDEPITWIVGNGWLPQDEVVLFSANGGAGKSTIALQMCVSAVSGRPWLHNPVEKKVQALYVSCEDSRKAVRLRLKAILRSAEYAGVDLREEPLKLRLWFRNTEANSDIVSQDLKGNPVIGPFAKRLGEYITEKMAPKEPFLLILDTSADIFSGNENIRNHVRFFIRKALYPLARKYNATIILLGHTAKDGNFSGSTDWHNAVRCRYSVQGVDSRPNERTLKREKGNYSGVSEVKISFDSGVFRALGDFEEVSNDEKDRDSLYDAISKRADIGRAIAGNGAGGLSKTEVYDSRGYLMSEKRKQFLADWLLEEKKLIFRTNQRNGNGYWPNTEKYLLIADTTKKKGGVKNDSV